MGETATDKRRSHRDAMCVSIPRAGFGWVWPRLGFTWLALRGCFNPAGGIWVDLATRSPTFLHQMTRFQSRGRDLGGFGFWSDVMALTLSICFNPAGGIWVGLAMSTGVQLAHVGVSIPRAGFGWVWPSCDWPGQPVSRFQSRGRDLGGFWPRRPVQPLTRRSRFQSHGRDLGGFGRFAAVLDLHRHAVSIPRAGFGWVLAVQRPPPPDHARRCFNPAGGIWVGSGCRRGRVGRWSITCFNPAGGIWVVLAAVPATSSPVQPFQSRGRDSGGFWLAHCRRTPHRPEFQSRGRDLGGFWPGAPSTVRANLSHVSIPRAGFGWVLANNQV